MTDQQQKPTFAPSEEFAAQANFGAEVYDRAAAEGPEFWAQQARELLSWSQDFTETLDWSNPPFAKWFADGTLNAAYNAVDRHVEAGNGDRTALLFERASPVTSAPTPTPSSRTRSPRPPTRCSRWASPREIAWASTCPWSRRP